MSIAEPERGGYPRTVATTSPRRARPRPDPQPSDAPAREAPRATSPGRVARRLVLLGGPPARGGHGARHAGEPGDPPPRPGGGRPAAALGRRARLPARSGDRHPPVRGRRRHHRRPATALGPPAEGRARGGHVRPGRRRAADRRQRRLSERPVLRPLRGRRPAGPDPRHPLLHRRPDDGRRPGVRRHGHLHPARRGVRRGGDRPGPGAGRPCRDRDRERRADRPAGALPGGGRAASGDRARPARDRRPDHGPPRSDRGAPARRRRGRRPPRCRRRPDRPPRRERWRPLLGLRRRDGQAARPRPDRGERRGEGRRGDLRAGRSRDAAGLHRRLPPRRSLRARRRAGRPREAPRHPVRDRGAARWRPRPDGDPHRLHGRRRRVHRGRRTAAGGARGPGRDRDDQCPADRGAGDVAGRRAAAGGRGAGAPGDRRPDHRDPRFGRPPPARRRRGRPPAPRGPGPDRPDRARGRARRLHVPRRGPAHRRRGRRRGRRAIRLRCLRSGDRRAANGRRRRLPPR